MFTGAPGSNSSSTVSGTSTKAGPWFLINYIYKGNLYC
jgi:hypothetical protein